MYFCTSKASTGVPDLGVAPTLLRVLLWQSSVGVSCVWRVSAAPAERRQYLYSFVPAIYTCVCVCARARECVYIYKYTYIYVHTHTRTRTRTDTHTHTHTHTHTNTHINKHTHTHKHTHPPTSTHTHLRSAVVHGPRTWEHPAPVFHQHLRLDCSVKWHGHLGAQSAYVSTRQHTSAYISICQPSTCGWINPSSGTGTYITYSLVIERERELYID